MLDLGYAFTIYFVTLGPLKTIPAFFATTRDADRRTIVGLAVRSTVLATIIVLFVALVASGTMATWRVSPDAMAIAGGLVLLTSSVTMLTGFQLADSTAGSGIVSSAQSNTRWMGRPVLSPLAIPAIVTPVGIVAILYFSGLALGNAVVQAQLAGVLLGIMALNLLAMLCAAPIMRVVGLPVLQVLGWVFSALQAGLGVEAVIGAVRRLVICAGLVIAIPATLAAQELEPRAYSPSPTGTTFVVGGFGRSQGAILMDPSLDVDNVEGDLWIATAGIGRVFGLAGRQARVLAVLPIAWGTIAGDVHGQAEQQGLAGAVDPRIKLSIGLRGAPALKPAEFARAPRQAVVGASVTVMPPWGRYESTRLVNLGYNRWGMKPEVGVSHQVGPWTLDAYAGVWWFSTNNASFPGRARKRQDPVVTWQTHASRALPRRTWIAFNGTWFAGGQTRVDRVDNPDEQRNSRLGATFSVPIAARQSLKFIYSTGATTRRGSDFNTFNITWQLVMY